MIGSVEKDEPVPIVVIRPTTKHDHGGPVPSEPLNIAEVCWTRGSIWPDAFRTDA